MLLLSRNKVLGQIKQGGELNSARGPCICYLCSRDVLVKTMLHGLSEIFLPMLFSRILMVSQLIFNSFVHLEFIFVYGVNWWSSFIFLHVAVQISQHCLLKSLFYYSILCFCPLCQILIDSRDMVYFCFIGLCVCSYASTRLF